MVQEIAKIAHIDPALAGATLDEMLPLVLPLAAERLPLIFMTPERWLRPICSHKNAHKQPHLTQDLFTFAT